MVSFKDSMIVYVLIVYRVVVSRFLHCSQNPVWSGNDTPIDFHHCRVPPPLRT